MNGHVAQQIADRLNDIADTFDAHVDQIVDTLAAAPADQDTTADQ